MSVRPLDLALFLLGETALTKGELAEWAGRLGHPREVPEGEAPVLMRVVEANT